MLNQISIFELINLEETLSPERQKFRRALKTGSGFQGGKKRIIENSKLPKKDFADFLRKEYGIGGSSFENGFIDYNSKGFTISEEHFTKKKVYTWAQVADEILDLLNTNSY